MKDSKAQPETVNGSGSSDCSTALPRQKLDLMCPICDREAEFERASGFGGINTRELFRCEWCEVKIERHCRNDGSISRIEVGRAKP